MFDIEFKNVLDLYDYFGTEEDCILFLEAKRWGGNVVSPFDKDSTIYECKNHRYKCKNTGKYFNVKTDTLFHDTKIPLKKWFAAIWYFNTHKKGVSSVYLSEQLNITQKSAWFMLQRIRNCFGENVEERRLEGEVEVDESYVGGEPKNRKLHIRMNEYVRKQEKYKKIGVLGMVERKGNVIAKIIHSSEKDVLEPIIFRNVVKSSTVYTDSFSSYGQLGKYYEHHTINHSEKKYVRDEHIHTNTIESFWAYMKRGLKGIYHFTSKRHLQLYIDEFCFRYNRRNFSNSERFNNFFTNIEKRLLYKELIDEDREAGQAYGWGY